MNDKEKRYLAALKKVREEKDIDQIGEFFLSIIDIYGLTMDEVASLSYYLFQSSLEAKHNKDFLRDKFAIDVGKLGIDGKLQVQKVLLSTFYEKVKNNGKA